MEITYDSAKSETNVAKHGVSLGLAKHLDGSEVMAYVDTRFAYPELREIGFGVIDDRLYCMVFTQRGDAMHIISMLKANKREVRSYVDQT